MSSARARLALVGALLAGVSVSAEAQDRRELAQRVRIGVARGDSTSRALRTLALQETVNRFYSDTLTMLDGTVTVVTTSILRPIVAEAIALADSTLLPIVRPVIGHLRGKVVTIREDTMWRRIDGSRYVVISEYTAQSGEAFGGGYIGADRVSIAGRLGDRMQQAIVSNGSKPVKAWLPGLLPVEAPHPQAWANTRLELISSDAVAGRRCYDGDRDACAKMLGLRPVADPATQLFDSAGRWTVVKGAINQARRTDALATDRCLKHSDSACTTVLRAMLNRADPQARNPQLRSTFAQVALSMGGPGAIVRLVQSTDSIGGALTAAAGVPLDSVTGIWLRELTVQGIGSDDFTPGIALLAIGWVIVLGLVSLGSGRWR